MVLYQQGEYPAFEELYRRHSGRVLGYLRKLISASGEAEDLMQQTFFRLHQSRERYDVRFPFLPWLFTIVRNLQIDFLRKQRPIPVESHELDVADEKDLEGARELSESQFLLDSSVAQLSEAERKLIAMRFQEGLTFDEISKALGISEQSARKRASRTVERLRKLIQAK